MASRLATGSVTEARSPVLNRKLTAAQRRRAYANILLPPPDAATVDRIVYGDSSAGDWRQRLTAATSLASPDQLAGTISTGMVLGETPRQIEAKLRPVVQGVRNSARRIARTETIRVAHSVQMEAWERLGDQIVGYQVFATLDSHTRPWHAARHGTVYYRHPKPGQKGPQQMPHPPMEAADPRERPPGTPATAFNCRCFLAPVMASLHEVESDPVRRATFSDAADRLIPDPATYQDWWQTAPAAERRLAVGARRYRTLAARLPEGEAPAWEHFLDARTGDLVSPQRLKSETIAQRNERVAQVRLLIARLRGLVRQVATFGYVAGGE